MAGHSSSCCLLSIDKYTFPVSHSSLISITTALARRKAEASLGNSPATLVRRLICLLRHSIMFDVVPASDPRIQYIGRFDVSNPDAPRFAWSGSIIKARYKAERITLLLKDDPPANRTDDSGAPFRNWFDVLIDGHLAVTIVASPNRTRYEIPRPLDNGPHTITFFKRTEAVVGVCTFLGFELSEGGKLLDPPARPARRIEFVGDSITAGLDVVKVGAGVFTLAAENNRLDYSAVAARRLSAESICIAYSGNSIHCNAGGGKRNTMPVLYERIIPQEPDSRWDFTRWTPQVVVMHLGTNNVGAAVSGLCTDDFQLCIDSYVKFVARVRKQYPQAHIFCMIGPAHRPRRAGQCHLAASRHC